MAQISVEQLVNDPMGLIACVEAGEPFVITRNGQPIAEVVPFVDAKKKMRPAGLCKGQFVVPDDFDDPLPEEILREFYGDIFPEPSAGEGGAFRT
jgi:antitoxin (DNA-binding transcriptional repressor) of toxin-antitoxin stability system